MSEPSSVRALADAPAAETPPHSRVRQASLSVGVALLTVLGAMLVRAAITPVLGTRVPFLTFFPAVTIAARYGGLWAGVASTLLATAIAAFALLEPRWNIVVADSGDLVALALFLTTGIFIAWISESLRRQRAEATRARVEAEHAAEIARAAQRVAVAAARAKDEFLSVVGHELRTPLTSILGWADILRRRPDPATTARALEIITRNARGQAQIIDDLLDVSRIVTGRLRLAIAPTDPAEVIRAAIEVMAPAAEAKGVTLEAALDPQAGPVAADPGRLQQMIWNLLSNAVKFNRAGGRVEVRLARVDGQAQIRVADTGAGIPADFLPHVFERFTQAESSSTRGHRGLGLGLAIVHTLVDLHGGTITAESDGPGKGAVFTLTLPRAAGIEPAAAPRAGGPEAASLEGVRVLVVDDDPDALDLLATILGGAGATVLTATSAAEALGIVAASPFEVLVSDINMPDLDGYALLKEATTLLAERRSRVMALALTAATGPKEAARAAGAGFAAYRTKPIVPDELERVVADLARRGRSQAASGAPPNGPVDAPLQGC